MSAKRTDTGKKQKHINATKEDMGAVEKPRRASFRVKATDGSEVSLVGSFNNWNNETNKMRLDGDGHYTTTILLAPGRHEYKFIVNGVWQTDPASPQQVPNAYGSMNSVVETA